MREHGVLDRSLLIYEAGTRKFASNEDFYPAIITGSAEIVRDFIRNSHEKSEEEAVFPRFRKVGKMVPLVDTLLAQHQAGRRVTQSILQFAPGSRKDGDGRRRLLIFYLIVCHNVSAACRTRGHRSVSDAEDSRLRT